MEKGLKFGRRTTLGECTKKGCDRLEKCVCECGTEKFVRRTHLKRGKSLSCGCYRTEANKEKLIQTNTTHGMYGTKFYKTYMGIRQRCNNPKANGYQAYGGRGIKCLRNTFEEFYEDMYDSFLEHIEKYGKDTSIDRIDVNGNYCKENCRRATNDIQQSNRRCCISVEHNGQVFPSIDSFAKYIGKSSRVVRIRLEQGRSLEEIDEVPLGMNRHQYYGDSKYLPDGHKIVYKGVEYKSRRDMCKILGIKYQTLNSRIKRGHGLEDSLEYLLNKKNKNDQH